MAEKLQYAREGYRFYSVSTPSVFLEYELPDSDEDATEEDIAKMYRLEDLALQYGRHVQCSEYRLG